MLKHWAINSGLRSQSSNLTPQRRNCKLLCQKETFVNLINLHDYEIAAQERIERTAWEYYQGGSGDEVTLRANREAFERIRLRPRMLADVSKLDLSTTVLGSP